MTLDNNLSKVLSNRLLVNFRKLPSDDFYLDTRSAGYSDESTELPAVGGRARRHSRGMSHQRFTDLNPTLDRFADDTSMLGFRYLHSRYKLWFRVMWALLLIFFLGLSRVPQYQKKNVSTRISTDKFF
jgi:hypothetical protein